VVVRQDGLDRKGCSGGRASSSRVRANAAIAPERVGISSEADDLAAGEGMPTLATILITSAISRTTPASAPAVRGRPSADPCRQARAPRPRTGGGRCGWREHRAWMTSKCAEGTYPIRVLGERLGNKAAHPESERDTPRTKEDQEGHPEPVVSKGRCKHRPSREVDG
jgi:hypothetical protein